MFLTIFKTSISFYIITLIIFFKNNDKIKNLGNNISTIEDLQNYILNITSYEDEVEITVQSNKTTNTENLTFDLHTLCFTPD